MLTARIVSIAVMSCAVLAACSSGPRQLRSEPPGLQVDSLEIDGGEAGLGLLVHNRNDHPIVVTGAGLTMRIDGEVLFDRFWPINVDIGPRLRERITLTTEARSRAIRRLEEISTERDATGRYVLSGEIRVDGADDHRREVRGFLHPVPGQPGQFR